ncbi:DUF1742-domain-containing protein [Canariomyces notabilis]|uniref:DUF1742-domain-containing protein n=1 Tax=Canariomyces notabilis TaxID=2074819 RepID=A0AAN6QH87_9PEZI|nr:DUF1742-domain-containing protein [Canariomyces arenarius]
MEFPNIYTHRKVAETSAKSCDICFKLSSSVLITPDSKDWFYVCPAHLKDPNFCTPKIDQAAIEARKKKELEAEIERVKKEYEEKQKKKKAKAADAAAGENNNTSDDKKVQDGKQSEGDKDKKQEDEKQQAEAQAKAASPSSPVEEEEPRIFELKRTFYQQRLNKKRQVEIAKRNRERMRDPNFFPSVPKSLPS